jgi:hypothetical protein
MFPIVQITRGFQPGFPSGSSAGVATTLRQAEAMKTSAQKKKTRSPYPGPFLALSSVRWTWERSFGVAYPACLYNRFPITGSRPRGVTPKACLSIRIFQPAPF